MVRCMPHDLTETDPPAALIEEPTRAEVLRLAAAADVDMRSARKAILHGASCVRGDPGVRLARAMRQGGT
jgi:hypothetical protein